jgi:hypothetical protein
MVHKRRPVRVVAVIRRAALAVAAALAAASVSAVRAQECLVPAAEIERWMRIESAKGYDLLKTANGVRLQSAVILGLVRDAIAQSAPRRLWMRHERYFDAYVAVTGVSATDAPQFVIAARDNREDMVIDYGAERVVAAVEQGEPPDLAVNVVAGWQGGPESYTYEDRGASPPLRVTHERVSSFRVLTYGDVVVYDAIEGVHGRATGGALGAVFRLIGDGKAVSSRFVIASDGVQVTRTTAKKGFQITQTATVFPDGRGERGLPRRREDLKALEDQLREPLKLRYVPLDLATMPDAPSEDCG